MAGGSVINRGNNKTSLLGRIAFFYKKYPVKATFITLGLLLGLAAFVVGTVFTGGALAGAAFATGGIIGATFGGSVTLIAIAGGITAGVGALIAAFSVSAHWMKKKIDLSANSREMPPKDQGTNTATIQANIRKAAESSDAKSKLSQQRGDESSQEINKTKAKKLLDNYKNKKTSFSHVQYNELINLATNDDLKDQKYIIKLREILKTEDFRDAYRALETKDKDPTAYFQYAAFAKIYSDRFSNGFYEPFKNDLEETYKNFETVYRENGAWKQTADLIYNLLKELSSSSEPDVNENKPCSDSNQTNYYPSK